jgi:hypothetical protein
MSYFPSDTKVVLNMSTISNSMDSSNSSVSLLSRSETPFQRMYNVLGFECKKGEERRKDVILPIKYKRHTKE